MKNLILYLYHLLTWFLILMWGYALDFLPKVKRFLSNWHEVLTIPLALVLWYLSPTFLRWLDPVAATFDAGALQVYLLAAIGLLFLTGVSWLIFKLTFPNIVKWIDKEFEEAFKEKSMLPNPSERDKMFYLTTIQKCGLSWLLFVTFLFAAVLLVKM